MPTSLLSTDTMVPNFKGNETTEEKVDQIQNYLYMLVEQLRYSMANIGEENFNETEFDNIVNLITEPVYFQMTNEDGAVNQMLHIAEDRLISQISGVSKDLEALGETVSKIQQTSNNITLEVSNGSTSSSIKLYKDGVEIDSDNITFSGYATFEGLAGSGKTIINGDNIRTGTIRGIAYRASTEDACFVVTTEDLFTSDGSLIQEGKIIGGIRYAEDGFDAFKDKVYLYTAPRSDSFQTFYPSVKIESVGRISIEAPNDSSAIGGGGVFIQGGSKDDYGIVHPGYITLESTGKISINQDSTYWEFANGTLYRNGVAMF